MTVEKIQRDFIASEDAHTRQDGDASGINLFDGTALQFGDAALLQTPAYALPTVQSSLSSSSGAGGPDLNLPAFSDRIFPVPPAHNDTGAQIVFVDPGIHDLSALLAGIKPGMDVVMLDPNRDALDQIAETLNGQRNVASVNIIAEGSSGQIDFSSGALSLGNITNGSHVSDFAALGKVLGTQGGLMIWSCDTGQGAAGQAFINALAQQTGDNVAASAGLTGVASLGGNWALEAQTGPIHPTVPPTSEGIQHYDSDLGVTFSIIYPSYKPSAHPVYAPGSAQVGFNYGTPGDNAVDNIYPGYKASPPAYPGTPNSSSPSDFTPLGSSVVFVATDATHGRELWITDGTVAGTHLLDDIDPGAGSAFLPISGGAVPMQVVGSELFFAANDGTHGTELWETDGIAADTHMVKDIDPGSSSSNVSSMVNFDGRLFFTA
ncbi:MAG: DUF4347 domain-containing protein, partial [Rhizomicrobium sp.]